MGSEKNDRIAIEELERRAVAYVDNFRAATKHVCSDPSITIEGDEFVFVLDIGETKPIKIRAKDFSAFKKEVESEIPKRLSSLIQVL